MISFKRNRKRGNGFMNLNTTATSDISFMLLIFFLVTTSMEVDKAMSRQIPPSNPDATQKMDVDRTKVITLHLMKGGKLTIDDQPAEIEGSGLRRQLKDFIVKVGPSHIVEVVSDRDADYESYFNLQNQIVRSYRELRDASAKQRVGFPFAQCNEETRNAILQAYPQRIQETTPAND